MLDTGGGSVCTSYVIVNGVKYDVQLYKSHDNAIVHSV